MRNKEKDAAQMAIKRRDFLSKAYELFAKKNIESVTMVEVARESGYGTMTLYRYFKTKPQLVVAVGAWIWEQAIRENWEYRPGRDLEGMTGAEIFEYYLESFIGLYRNHRDLLRFNQFFNVYIQSERIDPEVLKPYRDMIEKLRRNFHMVYEKAVQDHTIRTDESEEEMRQMCRWIAGLEGTVPGREIPLHISRFFPRFHMTDRGPTPVKKIYRLAEVAAEQLKYVYTGNC